MRPLTRKSWTERFAWAFAAETDCPPFYAADAARDAARRQRESHGCLALLWDDPWDEAAYEALLTLDAAVFNTQDQQQRTARMRKAMEAMPIATPEHSRPPFMVNCRARHPSYDLATGAVVFDGDKTTVVPAADESRLELELVR